MGNVTYINGLLVRSEEAVVSARDAGFLYGDGLFETMRAYSGRIFALDKHLRRLAAGAKEIKIDNVPPADRLKMIIEATIWANNDPDIVVRITLTRGEPGANTCTIVVQTRPIGYSAEDYDSGVACMTMPDLRSGISRLKSLNHLPNILAKREAADRGFFEALLIDRDGNLSEGASSNVFLVSGGILRTPASDHGILKGVTRETVMDIAKAVGTEIREQAIGKEETYDAEEAFITNSVMEIMPVVSIDGRSIGSGHPGQITRKLLAAYRTMAHTSIESA